ncbi:hypothetical protein DVH24_038902 [Malus domestica]|uniref:Uncharacterized protein n=1 Tax=Malus domestica TaxID=3750 RepID=A0A498KAX1_MALDO|nr:hypothetical protein DVH24_038902 [Malus domestica]
MPRTLTLARFKALMLFLSVFLNLYFIFLHEPPTLLSIYTSFSTTCRHLVFAVASSRSWSHREPYLLLWCSPASTRTFAFLDRAPINSFDEKFVTPVVVSDIDQHHSPDLSTVFGLNPNQSSIDPQALVHNQCVELVHHANASVHQPYASPAPPHPNLPLRHYRYLPLPPQFPYRNLTLLELLSRDISARNWVNEGKNDIVLGSEIDVALGNSEACAKGWDLVVVRGESDSKNGVEEVTELVVGEGRRIVLHGTELGIAVRN